MRRVPIACLAMAVFVSACSDPSAPALGLVRVTVQTSGVDTDPDGYLAVVNNGINVTVPASGTATLHLSPGSYSVSLSGLAGNCAVQGAAGAAVTLEEGDRVDVNFAVTCTAITGAIKVQALTDGLDPAPDGYRARVDAGAERILGVSDSLVVTGLSAGVHQVSLEHLPNNCTTMSPVQAVTVTVGGLTRDTVSASFPVTCVAVTGVALISVVTTAVDPDPLPGWALVVDNQAQPIGANQSLALTTLGGGDHQLGLTNLPWNCSVSGANPRTVTIAVGATTRDTVVERFDVGCTTVWGVVRVTAAVSGSDVDSVYQVSVEQDYYYTADDYALRAGGEVLLRFQGGTGLSIWLDDVAPNCQVSPGGQLGLVASAGDTLDVNFVVQCVALGTLHVTAPTTGADPDDGYDLWAVAQGGYQSSSRLPVGGAVDLRYPGGWQVVLRLNDVAPNCAPVGPDSVVVSIVGGTTTDVQLPVSCVALSQGGTIRAVVTSAGNSVPPSYTLAVTTPLTQYYPVAANGSVSFQAYPVAPYTLLLLVPQNCTVSGPNPAQASAVAGATVDVPFDVTCVQIPPPGMVRVSVLVSGTNQDLHYSLYVDDGGYYGYSTALDAGVPIVLSFSPYFSPTFWLGLIDPNCTLAGPNPVTVQPVWGSTVDLAFNVTCQ